jgi:hypothetical protein
VITAVVIVVVTVVVVVVVFFVVVIVDAASSSSQGYLLCAPLSHLSPQTTPFISLYGGSRSVVFDGDRDIRRRRSVRVIIIQIISLAVSVFLGGQSEELDQIKAQWRCP